MVTQPSTTPQVQEGWPSLIISSVDIDNLKVLTKKWLTDQQLQFNRIEWLILEPQTSNLKIDQVRQLKTQLSFQPHPDMARIAILCPADKLTTPAQHALLKVLEEPPHQTLLCLGVTSPENLLETIQSRCLVLPSRHIVPQPQKIALLSDVLKLSHGQILSWVDQHINNSESAQVLFESWMYQLHHILQTQPDQSQVLDQLQTLSQKLALFKTNANPKLLTEDVLFLLKKKA